MIDEIRAVLTRHLPRYAVHSIARLGEGSDNVVYEVNGELIVRRSKEADPVRRHDATRREADLLAVVTELATVPVPEPILADLEAGVLAYARLPGRPLSEQPAVAEPARLAATLGGFVSRLHRAPVARMERLVPRDLDSLLTWRQGAEHDYREIVAQVPASARVRVEDFLGRTPPAEPQALAFCHNDLGSEHVLMDAESGAVTGVIDWTDAAIADPVHDLARLYRDLGSEFFDLMLSHYEGRLDDADRERAVFYARCTLLEDVAYGVRTGERRYAEAGLAHLARTFA